MLGLQMSPKKLAKEWAAATNGAAEALSPEQQEAVLKEHCRVFDFNNRIIADFKVRSCFLQTRLQLAACMYIRCE